MADVIVSSIQIRLRHPVHEAGMTNQFDATTQEWVVDEDGRAVALPEKGPFTPQQLTAKGLTLPVIMNQALQTAVADRAAAMADALGLTTELDAKQEELGAATAEALRLTAALDTKQAELDAALALIAQYDAAAAAASAQVEAEAVTLATVEPEKTTKSFNWFG